MKKKIMVFMLLLSMLIGMGVPEQAKAASLEDYPDVPSDLNYEYFIGSTASSGFSFLYASHLPFYYSDGYVRNDDGVYKMKLVDGEWVYVEMVGSQEGYKLTSSFPAFSNHHIVNSEDGSIFFTANYVEPYTFIEWCSDAGLNCAASSNESDSVIPFWYEPDSYNYIVRKTLTASSTSGVYQMTMLQKTDGAHYPYYFEVNDIGYLGIAGAFSDTSAFTVRNFYYDAEGNGWKYIERFDVSTLPFDNTNVTFDENVVFIYSDTDIYADREASSIWQPASTEYYNVDIPEPEITRVPVGGGTTVGGNAEPGGLLDFLITLITMLWTKLFAVEVPVDGYMISFQQIVIYGALAGLLGWLFYRIFKKE